MALGDGHLMVHRAETVTIVRGWVGNTPVVRLIAEAADEQEMRVTVFGAHDGVPIPTTVKEEARDVD